MCIMNCFIIFVLGHSPLLPDVIDNNCLCWNYDKVLEIFKRHQSVCAYLCGHVHVFSTNTDSNNIHHVTFPGVVESITAEQSFCTLNFFVDHIEVINGDTTLTSLFYSRR